MLRIRKITDTRMPSDQQVLAEVEALIRLQFPGLREADIAKLPEQLENPFKYGFVSELLVSEDAKGVLRGFAIQLFEPDLKFAYLELIATLPRMQGGGLGAALYQRVREEAIAHGTEGLYFECLPDVPALSPDARTRRQNAARLRFYERYGARPILGTAYETPIEPATTDSPYLVFDALGGAGLPDAPRLQAIIRAILERKYGDICPPAYIETVVASVRPDAYALRAPRYVAAQTNSKDQGAPTDAKPAEPIALVVNDRHSIHHIRERGYVEAPVRIRSILGELEKSGLFERVAARPFPDRAIREVHDGALVDYIQQACAEAPENKSVYPYVFPLRNPDRKPTERSVLAGYWCLDTFTPLNRHAYPAAREAVNCALTAAEQVLSGRRLAYALVRPPGHHAERRAFGGFCYFNNAAVAANWLARKTRSRVAVFDIDYHHGNGSQDIFYERADILTVSVHGDPSYAYPYFTGFNDETGRGRGAGYNLNLPLPETITADQHRAAVRQGLARIDRHDPRFLVLAMGFDTGQGDPTGTWPNRAADFRELGRLIGTTGWPVLVVQEGGYRMRTLGVNARWFFTGLGEAAAATPLRQPRAKIGKGRAVAGMPRDLEGVTWRSAVMAEDVELVRSLVAGSGMFTTAETDIAAELVRARVDQGAASGYEFILAEADGHLIGFACFGPTPGTDHTVDLYWIAVAASFQRCGIGRSLLDQVEAVIRPRGSKHLYIDTSSTQRYAPTRAFYRGLGFRRMAELPDFYRAGDGKVIMRKVLSDVACDDEPTTDHHHHQ